MIILRMDRVLAELKVTAKEFVEASASVSPDGKTIRPNTITDLKNSKVKGIEFGTIDRILDTANRIAAEKGIEKRFDVNDIIEYRSKLT